MLVNNTEKALLQDTNLNKTLGNNTIPSWGEVASINRRNTTAEEKSESVYVAVFIISFNVVLHSVCALLLTKVYRNQQGSKPQRLFLLNLSVVELVTNFVNLGSTNAIAIDFGYHAETVYVIKSTVYSYLRFVYISAMFFITADRLFACLLNIRYVSICTVSRAKTALICKWCFFLVVIPSTFLISYACGGWILFLDVFRATDWFLNLVLCVSFLVFSISTYVIIFIFYVKSRRGSSTSQQSAMEMFKDSKFFVAVILIASFTMLMIIPSIVWCVMVYAYGTINTMLADILFILCLLSDTVDALIYVFIYPPVRNLLKKNIATTCLKCVRNNNPQASTTDTTEVTSEDVISTRSVGNETEF